MSKSIYIIVLVYRVTFRDSELLRPGLCPEGETQIKWSKKQLKMNTFTPQIQKQRRVQRNGKKSDMKLGKELKKKSSVFHFVLTQSYVTTYFVSILIRFLIVLLVFLLVSIIFMTSKINKIHKIMSKLRDRKRVGGEELCTQRRNRTEKKKQKTSGFQVSVNYSQKHSQRNLHTTNEVEPYNCP